MDFVLETYEDSLLNDFDKFMYNIESSLNEYNEIHPYYEIFESESKETKDKTKKNEETKKSIGNSIGNAIDSLVKFIKSIVNSIKAFITKLGMSKEDKELYNEIREAYAKNPKLKGTKITVLNYKEYKNAHDSLRKKLDQMEIDIDNGKHVNLDDTIQQVNTFVKTNPLQRFATHVGCDVALKISEKNKSFAKIISTFLEKDSNTLDILGQSIGEQTSQKYRDKIEKNSKKLKLFRSKALLSRSFFKGLENGTIYAVKKVKETIRGIEKIKKGVKKGSSVGSKATAIYHGVKNTVMHSGYVSSAMGVGK